MKNLVKFRTLTSTAIVLGCFYLNAQYTQTTPKALPEGVVAVEGPGSYGEAGTTYMLSGDISCDRSTLFLGKDVTLDLNGYTLSYADGNYEHIPNYGFEEGLKGWDLSKAPGAKIENTAEVHPVYRPETPVIKGRRYDLLSSYIELPVAGRSYYAMCGVTGHYYHDMGGDLANDMRISIYVDDAEGKEVRCLTTYGDTTLVSCPVENRSANLGAGLSWPI